MQFDICHRMGTIVNVVFRDLDLNCQGQTFQVATLVSKDWKNTNNIISIR